MIMYNLKWRCKIFEKEKIPQFISRRAYASVGNFMTHPLRLYPRKLSGRIDYSYIDRGRFIGNGAARFEIDRPWNDFGNSTTSRIPFLHLRTALVIRYLFLSLIEGRCEIFIQPEDLSFVKSVHALYLSHLEKRHVFRISFCLNELRLALQRMYRL